MTSGEKIEIAFTSFSHPVYIKSYEDLTNFIMNLIIQFIMLKEALIKAIRLNRSAG